jgi:hypothetical protein
LCLHRIGHGSAIFVATNNHWQQKEIHTGTIANSLGGTTGLRADMECRNWVDQPDKDETN